MEYTLMYKDLSVLDIDLDEAASSVEQDVERNAAQDYHFKQEM